MNLSHKIKYISLAATLGLIAPMSVLAQSNNTSDSVLKTQTFDVYQIYIPEVQKKSKERITPDLPKFDTINPVYQYTVPEQKLSYSYQAVPIRPLALGLENQVPGFENYVKAGFGNYTSVLLDAGISTLQTENFQSIIHAQHLSQKGGNVTNRQSSQTNVSAKGYSQFKNHDVFAAINYNRRGGAYYGLRPDTLLEAPSLDSVRQAYWGINGKVGFENDATHKFRYKPSVGVGYFADRNDANETNVQIDLPVSYRVDSIFTLGIGVHGNFNQYKVLGTSMSNNAFYVHPYVQMNLATANIQIGAKPTWGANDKFYFLPEITAQAPLIENKLRIQGGFKGELVQNTFQQLATKNPFIYQNTNVMQTRQLKAFGGFDASLSQHISFGGSISWNNWTNLPVFMNDYNRTADGRYFKVMYDTKVTGISFDGYFKYQINEHFGLIGSGAWTSFTKKTDFNKIYHEPMMKIGAEVFAKPIKGLFVSAKLDYIDRLYYYSITQETEKMPSIVDLSIQGEYQIIPRLSVFLQLNNVLNNQYNRYYQYDVYGFNIIGGLRLKF